MSNFVHFKNALPGVSNILPDIVQEWVDEQADGLANNLRSEVPSDAMAAPAIVEGIYVRTPTESGYTAAAQRVEALFAGDLSALFAGALPELFAPTLKALFAPALQALMDPKILPEVDEPPPGTAVVACATAWGGISEHGSKAKPFWWGTVRAFEPDTESFGEKLERETR